MTAKQMPAFAAKVDELIAATAAQPKPAYNALVHGLTAEMVLLKHEDPLAYAQVLADLRLENRPRNSTEDACINQMAAAYWKVTRAEHIEKALWELEIDGATPDQTPIHRMAYAFHKCGDMTIALERLNRYQSQARRAYHQAASTLRLHQKWAAKNQVDIVDTAFKTDEIDVYLIERLKDQARYRKYQKIADADEQRVYETRSAPAAVASAAPR